MPLSPTNTHWAVVSFFCFLDLASAQIFFIRRNVHLRLRITAFAFRRSPAYKPDLAPLPPSLLVSDPTRIFAMVLTPLCWRGALFGFLLVFCWLGGWGCCVHIYPLLPSPASFINASTPFMGLTARLVWLPTFSFFSFFKPPFRLFFPPQTNPH